MPHGDAALMSYSGRVRGPTWPTAVQVPRSSSLHCGEVAYQIPLHMSVTLTGVGQRIQASVRCYQKSCLQTTCYSVSDFPDLMLASTGRLCTGPRLCNVFPEQLTCRPTTSAASAWATLRRSRAASTRRTCPPPTPSSLPSATPSASWPPRSPSRPSATSSSARTTPRQRPPPPAPLSPSTSASCTARSQSCSRTGGRRRRCGCCCARAASWPGAARRRRRRSCCGRRWRCTSGGARCRPRRRRASARSCTACETFGSCQRRRCATSRRGYGGMRRHCPFTWTGCVPSAPASAAAAAADPDSTDPLGHSVCAHSQCGRMHEVKTREGRCSCYGR